MRGFGIPVVVPRLLRALAMAAVPRVFIPAANEVVALPAICGIPAARASVVRVRGLSATSAAPALDQPLSTDALPAGQRRHEGDVATAAAAAAAARRDFCPRSCPAPCRDFVCRGGLCSCSPAPLRGLVGNDISCGRPGAESSAQGSESAPPPLPPSPPGLVCDDATLTAVRTRMPHQQPPPPQYRGADPPAASSARTLPSRGRRRRSLLGRPAAGPLSAAAGRPLFPLSATAASAKTTT